MATVMTVIAVGGSGRVFDRLVAPWRARAIAGAGAGLAADVLSRAFLLVNYVFGCVQVTVVAGALFGRVCARRTLASSVAVGAIVLAMDGARLALRVARGKETDETG